MIACGLNNHYYVINNVITPQSLSHQGKTQKTSGTNVLVVADLVDEIKNISGTIRAFAQALKSRPQMILNIIGHGPDEKKLRSIASEFGLLNKKIFFHGVKTNEEVYRALSESDFLIMNSRFETFSLICAEALFCGKPVIATRCGGPEEFITDEMGILINTDNKDELSSAIVHMYDTKDEFNPETLKLYAMNRFSGERIGNQFLEVYKAVLGLE
jgi:glycosyltransferase involved in cell wall biosynthesis